MNIISKKNEKISKIIINKNIDKTAIYRLSIFTYLYSKNSTKLIKNTITNQVFSLTEKEWDCINFIKNNNADYFYIEENDLIELIENRFLVNIDYDELGHYNQLLSILKIISDEKPGIKTYTILPTTGCNARCIYCYEKEYEVKNMDIFVAERLVDFICETKRDGKIILNWFGGEPIVKSEIITYICKKLKEKNIAFDSKMTSNASLFTDEIIVDAKKIWNLKSIQISLDGDREEYNNRKRYYNPKIHNYDKVIEVIHKLANNDIRVSLRCNVDSENLDNLKDFIDEIRRELKKYKNISLYLSLIFQENEKLECIELYKKMFDLTKYINEIGLSSFKWITNKQSFKEKYCMADNIEQSIVIDPDGYFYDCEHLQEENIWGNIFDGITDFEKFERLKKRDEINEKCAKCEFLPQCTPFYKNRCTCWFDKCYEYKCIETEFFLDSLITTIEKGE